MNTVIQELVGKKVTVYSNQPGMERQDVGVLESLDGIWMKIRKSESESMYFCLYQVRLIKPFYQ